MTSPPPPPSWRVDKTVMEAVWVIPAQCLGGYVTIIMPGGTVASTIHIKLFKGTVSRDFDNFLLLLKSKLTTWATYKQA